MVWLFVATIQRQLAERSFVIGHRWRHLNTQYLIGRMVVPYLTLVVERRILSAIASELPGEVVAKLRHRLLP